MRSCYCHLIFERRDLRAATQRSACLQSNSACCQNQAPPVFPRKVNRKQCKDSTKRGHSQIYLTNAGSSPVGAKAPEPDCPDSEPRQPKPRRRPVPKQQAERLPQSIAREGLRKIRAAPASGRLPERFFTGRMKGIRIFCLSLFVRKTERNAMNEKYVVNLRDVAIYHADNPFGSCSEKKLLQRGEMVLSEVNLSVAPGEFVYLIGRVGSGKSSLLKTLYAEMQLLTGKGYVAGFDLRRLRRKDIPYLRRRIGIVFQDYQLLTDRNVFMNLYYVMKATGWKREQEIRERIDRVLGLVELGSKSYKMPFELSGGEQQRLVIARALLNDPQVLLADEPTGNLDPVTADGIMQLFQKIASQGCAVVMSTHNTALIENYPARAVLFSKGKIREVDLKAELA